MPLRQLSLNASIAWQLQMPLPGFQPRRQGQDSKSFNLSGIDLDEFSEIYASVTELDPAEVMTIDLQDFTNLVGDPVTLSSVVAMQVIVEGVGEITVGPGDSNGLDWWYGAGVTLKARTDDDGGCIYKDPITAPQTVDATHRTIKIENTGGVTEPVTVTVILVGGVDLT